jgi:hypothetical protein
VSIDGIVHQPVEKVWSFFQTPESEMRWQPSILEETVVHDVVGVGMRCREVRAFLGRRMEAVWEITEYLPRKKVGFKSVESAIPYEGDYRFESLPDGTKFIYQIRMQKAKGFLRLATLLTNGLLRGQFRTDLGRLQDILEKLP